MEPGPELSVVAAFGLLYVVRHGRAAGPGGGGCFGFAWWQNDAKYQASVWDLSGLEDAGTVSADFSGTSFLPAVVVPIPLIARTQAKACQGLSDQLKLFVVGDQPVS